MSLKKINKSNMLVDASYQLSLWEQRLILAALSQIKPQTKVSKEVTISASNYAELMQISMKNAHRELYQAAEKLYERSVVIRHEDHTEEFRWIQKKAIYHKGEAKVSFTWSDDVLIYISELSGRFTSYRLADVAQLRTSYAIRIYELLMRFNKTKVRWIDLTDFRSLLKLEDKYPLFRDLNKWVIKPSIKEINTHSNLQVYFSTRKEGRNVSKLYFDFEEKKQMQFSFEKLISNKDEHGRTINEN
ncbi:replication initiation protein [Legionella septentrionalis]|uniref:replication initiation protein n=1 Tax=Legionella septentrionalis TaxID=2498109 RepID=UPI000F8F6372|nr:replication initiation protein [Legionella septentrionalis]RUQ92924.1 RepB family plasmid replication initiator protein [Legionella septentrionalis]